MLLTLPDQVRQMIPCKLQGSVSRISGLTAAVKDFHAPLGSYCHFHRDSLPPLEAEVVGFTGAETLLMPFGDLQGIRRGTPVILKRSTSTIRVGEGLLGRVINAQGQFIDGKPAALLPHRCALHLAPLSAFNRPRITQSFDTGVRAIDSMLTCGQGQRLGIFAGSGVGKSTLLGQLARYAKSDINVVVLIGERGREVREFLEKDLGAEGLKRSVVIVSTGDESALLRLKAAYLGTTIAEYFRDLGQNVLLMMDSVTRFALAQREIGLAAGEPPATRGYPPSVFALLPRLLERSGRTEAGSITGLYTVLVEGDDTNEPIADAVRGILDGHIVLSRKLANQGHFPAIDILSSISRLMTDVAGKDHLQAAAFLRQLLSAYQQAEDMITIGAYKQGSNQAVDAALMIRPQLLNFLQQVKTEHTPMNETVQQLSKLVKFRDTKIHA